MLELPEQSTNLDLKVTYHDACHLAHGQKVVSEPRVLVGGIDGVELNGLVESDMCCGAAGTYNLLQPEMAEQLGKRKLEKIKETGADVVLMGNVGCAMHLAAVAREIGIDVDIRHPVELLYDAYVGDA